MIPLSLTLSGFMSYRDAQTLDFQDDSLWVLIGKNASGKSSIFDAIIFALFGETRVAGINNNELINHNSDDAEITFDFASNGTKYRVTRTIPKKGGATRQASILLSRPDGLQAPQPIPGTHTDGGFKKWIENQLGLNYEVFVTSILLRQGKADAFLEAGTGTRYEVLSKLIDLAKYVALADKARGQKTYWHDQATFHRDSLNRMSPVTDQNLADAQSRIDLEEAAVEAARKMAERLQALYGQSSRWEQLDSDLGITNGKITSAQGLLERSNEIGKAYLRLVDLRTNLPAVKAIFDLAQTIQRVESDTAKLMEADLADEAIVRASEAKIAQLQLDHDQKAARHQEVSAESLRMFNRLQELSPIVSNIEQVSQREKTAMARRTALAEFADNLDDLLNKSTAKRDLLAEAERVYPGLKRLAGERSKLPGLIHRKGQLASAIQEKQGALPALKSAAAEALRAKEQAEVDDNEMRKAHTEATTLLREARKHIQNFNLVAGAAKCQYCGLELSEDHKADERDRLAKELAEKERLEVTAQGNSVRGGELLEGAKSLHQKTAAAVIALEGEIESSSRDLAACEQEINHQLSALGVTYDDLLPAYQARVASTKPVGAAEWAATTYPQTGDLAALESSVKSLSSAREEVSKLTQQVAARDQAKVRLSEATNSLEDAKKILPENWEALQEEHAKLSVAARTIKTILEDARKAQEEANRACEKAKAELGEVRQRQSRRGGTLTSYMDALDRDRKAREEQLSQLPEGWRTEAAGLASNRLSELSKEKVGLEKYDEQHQQLVAAGQDLKNLLDHKREVEGQIAAIPSEAHRSAEGVNLELTSALEARSQAETRLAAARTRRSQMESQKTQYEETERNFKAAERKSYLYGILSEQLGERGIQKAIVNKAEVAIVHLSNQVLDSLSGGRSKLKLREAGGNKKALDLEVWDTQTGGSKPILTSLASGSQRFRIAISLALGIGQYIGRESNRIESVIIDEGFGSLDREGRESIIQELYNLRQHLKRIILVSHQEEFSRGFSTGYEIHLVDGASRVQPLVR